MEGEKGKWVEQGHNYNQLLNEVSSKSIQIKVITSTVFDLYI